MAAAVAVAVAALDDVKVHNEAWNGLEVDAWACGSESQQLHWAGSLVRAAGRRCRLSVGRPE